MLSVAVAIWLLAAPSFAQPAPLSAEARAIAEAVPDGRAGSPDRTYVVSNEWAHRLFFPHLEGLGGAVIAVGADQGYTMAAVAGAELLWAVDYDPRIALAHRMYGALVPAAESPDALLALFEPDAVEAGIARIRERHTGEDEVDAVVRIYRRYRGRLRVYLRNLRRYAHGRTWLNDDALYAHVRALHRKLSLAREFGLHYEHAVGLHNGAEALLRMGEIDEAIRWLDESDTLSRRHDHQKLMSANERVRGFIDVIHRDRPEGRGRLRRVIACARGGGFVWDLIQGLFLMAFVEQYEGASDEALRLLREVEAVASSSGGHQDFQRWAQRARQDLARGETIRLPYT